MDGTDTTGVTESSYTLGMPEVSAGFLILW